MLTLAQVPIGVFDALTVAVAAISYGLGRKKGLVWQLSGVVTLLVGGVCATVLAKPVGSLFGEGILVTFAGWVLVYALVAICLYVLSLKLKHRIEKLEFDELDQRFGGVLGAFKGLFAFAILVLVASGLSTNIATAVRGSASGQALLFLVDELRPVVPERVSSALFPGESAAVPSPEPAPALDPTPSWIPEAPAQAPPPAIQLPTREPAGPPAWHEPEEPQDRPQRANDTGRADPDPWDSRVDPTDPLAPPR